MLYLCPMHNAVDPFLRLNDYNKTVNLELLLHLEQQAPSEARIPELMSHIINAHQIWLERINQNETGISVFGLRTAEDMPGQVEANHTVTMQVLNGRELEETIKYTNTQGKRFSNSIADILLHVFNHSTYHRGQINQLLVREGKKPMITDYITYNRSEISDIL